MDTNNQKSVRDTSGLYEEKQQLVDSVVEQMTVCSDMLGAPDGSKKKIYGFIPGINETEEQKHLRDRIKDIRQGLYQVMFTGVFSSGKSTLLNALMHSELLSTGNLPETAVITNIVFNEPDERAVIYKRDVDENGQPVTEVMRDIPAFFQIYKVDRNDKEKFLKIVDHVVLYQNRDGIAGSMVQLVDSPGTSASMADDKVSKSFLEKADAIVFLINALMPLQKDDKEYIEKYFAGHQMQNLFFVVNKVNMLTTDEAEEELKQYVRKELTDVFTDQYGSFDENLFRRRVFYVNALGAMNTRLGRETKISRNESKMFSDDETGVPEFEEALGQFLTSGDRDKETLKAYRRQMADFYIGAERSVEKQLAEMELGRDAVKKKIKEYEESKKKIETEIKYIEDDIQKAIEGILMDARIEYDRFVDNVEAKWDDYFSEKTGEMGVSTGKLLTGKFGQVLQFWKDKDLRNKEFEEAVQKATKPFTDGINSFMDSESTAFSAAIKERMEKRFAGLEADLSRHQSVMESYNIPIDIDQLIRDIAKEADVKLPEGQNNLNLGQAIIAILLADPEIIETAGGGKVGTLEFLADIIKTNIIDVIIMDILIAIFGATNPVTLVITIVSFILFKFAKKESRKEDNTKRLIEDTKNKILDGYVDKEGKQHDGLRRGGKSRFTETLGTKVGGAMNRARVSLTVEIGEKLDAAERQLNDILNKLEEDENAYAAEKKRTAANLAAFAEAVSTMSQLTTGTPLSTEEIKKLASGEEA